MFDGKPGLVLRKSTRYVRRVPVLAAGLVVILALFLALLPRRGGPAADPASAEPRVRLGRFQPVVILTGTLTALRSEELKAPITENYRVQIKWMAKEGDTVKPGDPVVRFDTSNLASSIETAQDSLRAKVQEQAQKDAELENQRFELDVAVKKAENDNRQKSLDASIPEGLESRFEYDRKQLEKKRSDHSLATARRERTVKLGEIENQMKTLAIEASELKAQLQKSKDSLDGMTLTAKTEGAVIYNVEEWSGRKVQVGDTVFATRTVATIPDLGSLCVRAWVSETHIQRIAAGQAVDLYLDAYPDRLFKGTIRDVSRSAEPVRRWGKSHYFQVDIEMEKLDLAVMKPGMSVRCEVRGPERKDVLLVPLEMTAFDGQSFWIRPAGEAKPVLLPVLDYDDFSAAADPKANPRLKPGTGLAPLGAVPAPPGEAKTDEKR